MRTGVIEWFNRPEYIYQPEKLLRRVLGRGAAYAGEETVQLRWGLPINIDNSEVIGRLISHHGIMEMPVVEALFRLIDPGDLVLDIGANIGYMTAVALAAGAGEVMCFEPHPSIYARLAQNVAVWQQAGRFAGRVEARQQAVSAEKGHALLGIPKVEFAGNNGVASLEREGRVRADEELRVETTTLDSVVAAAGRPVGVIKMDIEGHEFHAFKGGADSLRSGKIREVIYECFEGVGGAASRLLESYGYSIFCLRSSVAGPAVMGRLKAGRRAHGVHNLVATLEPERLRSRMAAKGFHCLSRATKAGTAGQSRTRESHEDPTVRARVSAQRRRHREGDLAFGRAVLPAGSFGDGGDADTGWAGQFPL